MKLSPTTFVALCEAEGFGRPEPEYEFARDAGRKWAFDWAWPAPWLIAVECEGGVYGKGKQCPLCKRRQGGAHGSVQGKLRDIQKYREAAIRGWCVISVLPQEIEDGSVLGLLKRAFEGRGKR